MNSFMLGQTKIIWLMEVAHTARESYSVNTHHSCKTTLAVLLRGNFLLNKDQKVRSRLSVSVTQHLQMNNNAVKEQI